jgi:sugar phosphate isomerase/epimerase
MLEEIKRAGYTGVEFAQHPEQLGAIDQLHKLLTNLDLRCLGMAGGSLSERIEFVKEFRAVANSRLGGNIASRKATKGHSHLASNSQPYVYLDEWGGMSPEVALQMGVRLAVHPHMFKEIQTAFDAEKLLEKYPGLWFLPDTGHLTVAGEDVVSVLDRNYSRIEAIHLKDWTAEFGRAYQFYSRGFVGLNNGDVRLEAIIKYLKQQRNYRKWVVVEQDITDDPFRSAEDSRQWLLAHQI